MIIKHRDEKSITLTPIFIKVGHFNKFINKLNCHITQIIKKNHDFYNK